MQPKPCLNVKFLRVLFGSSLITIGIFAIVQCTTFFNFVLSFAYSMHPGSFAFNVWKKYPMPMTIQVYVWNWTNPQDIYNHSTKPHFVQMGPYVFHEDKQKVNVTWNNNDTITFMQRRIWYFDEKLSSGNIDDKFTTLNPTSVSAAHKIRTWSYFMRKSFSFSLNALAPKIHITKSVGETLFHGYEDPLMRIAKAFPVLLQDHELDFDLTSKFGWFRVLNNSVKFNGIYNMATGSGDKPLGEILRWKYSDTLNIYKGKGACEKVRGSSGEFYPNVETSDTITFFSSEMCRSVDLEYEGDVEHFGIHGRKYYAGPKLLDNGTNVPGNECFCNDECVPSGAVNASACRYGTPSFVTLPHFYGADPYYLRGVDGMKPEKEKHEFAMAFEPKTRIPLKGTARLQLVLRMDPVKDVAMFEKVPTVFIPVLWFEQVVEIPGAYQMMIKILLALPAVTIFSGSVTIIVGLFIISKVMMEVIFPKYSKISTNLKINMENNAFLSPSHEKPYKMSSSFFAKQEQESFVRSDQDECV